MRYVIGLLLSLLLFGSMGIEYSNRRPVEATHREPPSYCVDPWASVDMGQFVYGPCKLVDLSRHKA
jgi:hypothetical protein